MINWAQTPIITGSGLVMMILKSTAFKVSPIPNMTTPSNIVMNPPNPKNGAGKIKAMTDIKITQTAKYFPATALNASNTFIPSHSF
jgi:hypothetical protein